MKPEFEDPQVGNDDDEFDELDGTHLSPKYYIHDFNIPCVQTSWENLTGPKNLYLLVHPQIRQSCERQVVTDPETIRVLMHLQSPPQAPAPNYQSLKRKMT